MLGDKKNDAIFCLSYFTAKSGCLDKLISALKQLIDPTRLEEGCLLYELTQDKENRHFLIVVEKFIHAKALVLHEEKPYVKNFVENVMDELCDKVSWHEAVVLA